MFWRAGYRPRDARGPCGCCTSCHEDDDGGWGSMCAGTFKGRDYYVCCRMAETLHMATAALFPVYGESPLTQLRREVEE